MRHRCGTLALAVALALPAAAQVTVERADLPAGATTHESLDAALEHVVRLMAETQPAPPLVVRLPPGVTRLRETLSLDARHSGRAGQALRLVGAADGTSVITTARVLDTWTPVGPAGRRLPRQAQAVTMQAQLLADEGFWPDGSRQGQGYADTRAPSEVLFRGRPLLPASAPSIGYGTLQAADPAQRTWTLAGLGTLQLAANSPVWLHGYPGEDWADEWMQVQPFSQADEVRLPGAEPRYGVRVGQRVRLVNDAAWLHEPGRWVLDRAAGVLLLWPPEPLRAGDVELTARDHVIQVDGASHIRIEDLTLEGSRGDAVLVRGGRDVQLLRSRIRNVGGRAVFASGTAHAVVDSDIEDTGQGGVVLWGGDRAMLQPAGHLAQGNRFRRLNRWLRTYRPAIVIGGVGQVARGNLVSGGPHAGIVFHGNDHLIEFNVLEHLVQETGDAGVIYAGADWTARGTIIRHNFLRDVSGPGRYGSRGVYLDDQASGMEVRGNLFVRVDGPVFLGGGRDNLVDNNLFVASTPAVHLDRRGATWQKVRSQDPDADLWRAWREMRADRGVWRDRYPSLARLPAEAPGEPRNNVARRLAVLDGRALDIEPEAFAGIEVDRIFGADSLPLRAGPALSLRQRATDFELGADASAIRDGFSPLALDGMDCTWARWQRVDRGLHRVPLPCPWRDR